MKKKKVVKKVAKKAAKIVKKAKKVVAKAKARKKWDKVYTEFKEGKLHSGSKKGPKVTNPKQAVAIAYSEAKRSYKKKSKRKK